MGFSLDLSNFSIDVNWKEIGERLLSIAGTGFLTMMTFTFFIMQDTAYQPSSTTSDLSPINLIGVVGGVMFIGSVVQLGVYGCWVIANLVAKRWHRLPVDK